MTKSQYFGQIVRDEREKLGWSIEKTAEYCQLSYKGLEEIELGYSNPKLSSILNIASVFDLDLVILTESTVS